MNREVEFLAYTYPDLIKVKIRDKIHTYQTSEFWARKAMVQMRFGEGWRGVEILKRNGKEVSQQLISRLETQNSK